MIDFLLCFWKAKIVSIVCITKQQIIIALLGKRHFGGICPRAVLIKAT